MGYLQAAEKNSASFNRPRANHPEHLVESVLKTLPEGGVKGRHLFVRKAGLEAPATGRQTVPQLGRAHPSETDHQIGPVEVQSYVVAEPTLAERLLNPVDELRRGPVIHYKGSHPEDLTLEVGG